VAWFSDPVIREFIKFAQTAPRLEDLKDYWRRMTANPGADFLGFFVNTDRRHVGNMKFETGPLPDEMHVGFLIGDPEWRKAGVLSETLVPCIERVRLVRQLRRVYLTVSPDNAAGVRAFTKLGFIDTGVIDEHGDLVMDYVAA
jgi:RimJ/RimL family protein N-acetyltransferase